MKQKIFALAVMMLTLIFSATTFAATVSYDATLNGHKYKIFNNGMTWDVAKTYCERLGGHLVTITSFAEQQVVEKLLQTKGTKNSYWAGAYRSNDGREYKPGQRFKWITGEVSDFNNFSANQPDNFQGNEDALMIYRNIANNRLGAWNDIKKDGTVNTDPAFGIKNFGFICEWDSTAPPPVTNIKGDANCDGRVDLVDIMDIVNYHNGKANNLKSTTNADVTKDGRIDESDAAIIKLIVVGVKIPDSFDGYSIDSKGNTHVYKVFNNGMTWQQARDYCKNQGGHLVTITSQGEQGEIDRRIQLNGNKNSYWIGGCKSGGTWKWITGEAVAYTHMAAGQPDGDGNALMAYRGRNALGWWNDVKSDGTCNGETFFGANNFGFICEWDTAQDKNIVMDTPEGKPLPANFQLSNYSLSSPANYQLRFSGRVWNANNQSERTGIHVYIGGGVGAGGQFIGEFGSDSNHNFNSTIDTKGRNGNQLIVIYAVNGTESKELDRRNINIAPASSGDLENLIRKFTTPRQYWDNRESNRIGSTCFGFANYIFRELHGVIAGSTLNWSKAYTISNLGSGVSCRYSGSVDENSLHNLLQQCKPGDFIQATRSNNSGQHTMIFVSYDAGTRKVRLFDANFTTAHDNLIQDRSTTTKSFITRFQKLSVYTK